MTPLMYAGLHACDETVSTLIYMGASPDKSDNDGGTALNTAIQSKCVTTIKLLAPVTHVNLGGALVRLVALNADLTKGELNKLVQEETRSSKNIKSKKVCQMARANASTDLAYYFS